METAKFYTKARRIPLLVGKMPSGARIWGGPYTFTQVGAGALTAFVLWKTTSLWAHLGGFMNVVVAVGIVVGVIWAAGKLPSTGRNPLGWVMDAFNLTANPGRLAGRQVTLPKARLLTHRVAFAARVTPVPRPGVPDAPGSSRRSAAQQGASWGGGAVRPARAVPSPVAVVTPADMLPRLVAEPVAESPWKSLDSPPDVSLEAAEAEARRKTAELTGVGQLLAGALQRRTTDAAPAAPREEPDA
ncbi:hypothetical protein [Antribacter gilvus]|uniref:hypothetical protein n=1 Tax=Antribacter gilvus TaxID=2304675 RepID=UPI000F783D36|nr:hypothetical protein [Antribacter gilvus]